MPPYGEAVRREAQTPPLFQSVPGQGPDVSKEDILDSLGPADMMWRRTNETS